MLSEFINENKLSGQFERSAVEYFIPLADQLAAHQNSADTPLFIGINGCQGSGKSTLASFLNAYWQQNYGLNSVVLSLDDFYYTREKRAELARDIHPLLATRGVPGTHDTQAIQCLLQQLTEGKTNLQIPRFDKASDNPLPKDQWPVLSKPADIVLFEGWCWGVTAQPEDALTAPVNTLETEQDPKGTWRQFVNQQLSTYYEPLYRLFEQWIMLKAPGFDDVYQWRLEQEQKLSQSTAPKQGKHIMSASEVRNFIQYYQRLTEHALNTLPARCDCVFALDSDRKITRRIKQGY
jgi:D-glycerate 3-kinase